MAAHYGTLGTYRFSETPTEDVRGSSVYGVDDEKLGKIDDVVFDHNTGNIRYAVIDTGGWLSSNKFVVPADRLSLSEKHKDDFQVPLTKQQIENFQLALGQYHLDTGTYPSTEQGLGALRTQPSGVDQWHGPYLEKELPNDPWGHAFVYKFPGEHGDEPDVLSYGADGQPGGTDYNSDIVSWK